MDASTHNKPYEYKPLDTIRNTVMPKDYKLTHTRREFLSASITVPATLAFASVLGVQTQIPEVRATPACGAGGARTPSQIEGPYFKPTSPLRTSLLDPGMPGTRIVVEGSVLTTDCRPMPQALVDFWQADDRGQYDNAGYRLRGHQFTDDTGHYRLETIVPGLYSGRTRHIHVKVQAPNQPVLTTQLYFPGESANQRDVIFNPDLVMQVHNVEGGKLATFDFVLDVRSSRS
jgi:protocatechuate 3,4-dioxygenase beta subunit